jgi:hypothetical protein
VRTVECAVLAVLANGPAKMTVLCVAARLNRKRLYRIVDAMHHAGSIKRLGVKGWSVWALAAYNGPRPIMRHPAHVVRTRPVADAAAPRTSWRIDLPTRDAFERARKACAETRGWGS